MVDFIQITFYHNPSLENVYLLANVSSLDKLLNPDILFFLVKIMGIAILLVVATIYLHLAKKKSVFNQLKTIKAIIDPLISHIIIEDSTATIKMQKKLKTLLTTNVAKRHTIDELIRSKQNYSGEVAEKIVLLYAELELKNYSLKKLKKNKAWHIQARGIQELYMMEQRDIYETIYQHTNNKNEFIRMEAQMGVIHLIGFRGLTFLEIISHPITDWQQIKLLEQLRLYPDKEGLTLKIPYWLKSNNETVVVFAIRLAFEYHLYAMEAFIQSCLLHSSNMVRSQAVKTIIQLETINTPQILVGHFKLASPNEQLLILDALQNIATEKEIPDLELMLDHTNDTIKLKAAIALNKCSKRGLTILNEKSKLISEPYARILKQVTSVS